MIRWTKLFQSARWDIFVIFGCCCYVLLLLWCEFSSLNCVSFVKGIFKFTAGRKLPTGFRRLKQSSKATDESVEGVGELDGQVNVIKSNVRSKKNIQEGYARADSLDKQQLKKYVKALAREAKLFRNARMKWFLARYQYQYKYWWSQERIIKANTAGFWINNKMMKINDDGGNDDLGLLWRKAMMMMRKPWRHWLERREPMLNQMVRQPQKSLSFSSLSWPGSTTSTTKVAWLYFKTQNKGKLLCHYFQIWTSFQTIGQLLKTLTGFVQLCRDMLVTNMKLMRREKYVLSPEFIFLIDLTQR